MMRSRKTVAEGSERERERERESESEGESRRRRRRASSLETLETALSRELN